MVGVMPSVTAGKVKGCSVGVFACELYGSPARSFGAAGRRWNSQPGRLRHFPRRARNPLPDLFSKHALNEGNRCRIEGEGSGRRGRSQEQEVPSASRRRGRPGRSCYPSDGGMRSAGAPTWTWEGRRGAPSLPRQMKNSVARPRLRLCPFWTWRPVGR
jgi:hypothetical protein